MKNVLIISAHPDTSSFCSAISASLFSGLSDNSDVNVQLITLAELEFDPILHKGMKEDQPLEPHLIKAQEAITRANDIIWIYPTWWGSLPALLKGFIDRTFLPGFAYQFTKFGIPKKLLKGRSSTIITTMDAPPALSIMMLDLSVRVLKNAVLNFCGLKVNKVIRFGPVRTSTPVKRMKFLEKLDEMGKNWQG
jgi:NAD(P)H dehydrogenase (quinone)